MHHKNPCEKMSLEELKTKAKALIREEMQKKRSTLVGYDILLKDIKQELEDAYMNEVHPTASEKLSELERESEALSTEMSSLIKRKQAIEMRCYHLRQEKNDQIGNIMRKRREVLQSIFQEVTKEEKKRQASEKRRTKKMKPTVS
jgi:hypothetical protein